MSDARPDLPNFEDPPVVEVAMSVQFETLEKLGAIQMGSVWQAFKARFPKTEEHPLLDSAIEIFEAPQKPQTRVSLLKRSLAPRCWFLNDEGTELIQIQRDRFAHNWRKVGEGDKYPRYDWIRLKFEEELSAFCGVLTSQGIGELTPNQCELTYLNHIVSGSGWERPGQLGEIFSVMGARYSDEWLGEPENGRFDLRYVIPDAENKPLGRLHVSMTPGYRKNDGKPLFKLQLTGRGKPRGEGVPSVLDFFDLAREWIVRGFASITTPKMHKIWRRQA